MKGQGIGQSKAFESLCSGHNSETSAPSHGDLDTAEVKGKLRNALKNRSHTWIDRVPIAGASVTTQPFLSHGLR